MCRSKLLGGRRCKCGSTQAARKRALDNRKKNRLARRNLASYFKSQEMNETAKAVMQMNPSAIPALLDEMKIDQAVLGVEAPNADRVAQDQRRNEQIIALALKESEGKEQEQLLDTSSMDNSVPQKTQEEIARGVAQFVIDAFEGDPDESGIFEDKNYERLNELYPHVNSLPVPDDEPDASNFWNGFSKSITSQISELRMGYVSDKTRRLMDTLGDEPLETVKFKELTNDEAKKVLDTENNIGDGSYVMDDMLDNIRFNNAGASLVDAGDGFYIYRNFTQATFLYIPAGQEGAEDLTVYRSRTLYSKFAHLTDHNKDYPRGLGLSKLSEKDKIEMIRKGDIAGYLYVMKEQKPLQTCVEVLTTEATNKPQVNPDLMKDLRSSHSYVKGKTLVHSLKPSTSFPPISAVALRNFASGHILGSERTAITKSFEQVYGEPDVDIRTVTRTYDEKLESKRFALTLDNDDDERIQSYTASGYTSYANIATGAVSQEESTTSEDLEKLNNRIIEFSKTIKHPRTVLRGQEPPYGMTPQSFLDSLEIGQTVTSSRLLSTSSKPELATNFNGDNGVVYVYRTRQGAAVSTISGHTTEHEVILPTGADFVCVGKGYEKGRAVVYLSDKDLVDD